MKLFLPALALMVISIGISCSGSHHSNSSGRDVISVTGGKILGLKEDGISIYKGVPFAAPPTGSRRWKAPQPVIPWDGIKQCTAFSASPMQPAPAPFSMWSAEFLIPKSPISEDCLYLNIWSGAKSKNEKAPVLVWIYGGGFSSGGSAVPIYDGHALAKKGIVFVSINYRVGIFGFFSHPALTVESGRKASGNYGLMDQIAALEWIRNNIENLGGDPLNVTIAGQSAGSMSVNCLVASPVAKGLFQKAIAQSGANLVSRLPELSEAERSGQDFAKVVLNKDHSDKDQINELRLVPAEKLMEQAPGMRGPVIDKYVLTDQVAEMFRANKQNRVALLTGWNEDEGLVFGPELNAEQFRVQAGKDYGDEAEKFLEYYPASTNEEALRSRLNLSRDLIFGIQNYSWAEWQSKIGDPVFVYRFARKVPATGEYVKYGAFHTGEVPYAFDNLQFVDRPWEPEDKKLAEIMSAYWVNFARSGNPNGQGQSQWPAYDSANKRLMVFDSNSREDVLRDSAALEFLKKSVLKRADLPSL